MEYSYIVFYKIFIEMKPSPIPEKRDLTEKPSSAPYGGSPAVNVLEHFIGTPDIETNVNDFKTQI